MFFDCHKVHETIPYRRPVKRKKIYSARHKGMAFPVDTWKGKKNSFRAAFSY